MTIKVQILKGNRYTLYNVTGLALRVNGATVTHSDKPPTEIQGWVEKIVRVGSPDTPDDRDGL